MWREQFPICQKDDQTEQNNYARVELSAATTRTIAEQQKFSASLKNAPRWPDVNTSPTGPSSRSPLCYPGLAGGILRGRPTPRFRTIQVCPKDLPAHLWQAEDAATGRGPRRE